MSDDWFIPTRSGWSSVEMPGHIIDMRQVDGRLLVRLEDGREINMTDWFSDKATPQ